jgi:hypothetical protein
MSLGDLAQALAILPIVLDGKMIQHQWLSTDGLAFKAGAARFKRACSSAASKQLTRTCQRIAVCTPARRSSYRRLAPRSRP